MIEKRPLALMAILTPPKRKHTTCSDTTLHFLYASLIIDLIVSSQGKIYLFINIPQMRKLEHKKDLQLASSKAMVEPESA